MNWDDAFANAPYIKDADAFREKWLLDAADFREEFRSIAELNKAYGTHEREVFDCFRHGSARGVLVFVHGGYWHQFDKDAWSHLAKGGIERGLDVYIPSYPLCPDVRISEITKSLANFVNQIDGNLPIYLTGHSAGGHLVARVICGDLLSTKTFERIKHIIPISGLFDLRPLLQTQMNKILQLDLDEARQESPALLEAKRVKLTAWVGGSERPEFIRQSKLISEIWTGLDIPIETKIESTKHHFDVIDGLSDPHSPLMQTLLES